MFQNDQTDHMVNDMMKFVSAPVAFTGMMFDCYMRFMTQQYWREIFATRYHPSHYEHTQHAQMEVPVEMVDENMESKLFV